MLMERRKGFVTRMRDVERRHLEIYGVPCPYYLIAADLYDRDGSQARVAASILERYGVSVSEKTAGSWINRGIAARRAAMAEAVAS